MLTFCLVIPLVYLGYKRLLTIDDMWEPLQPFLSEYNLKKFTKNYYKTCSKTIMVPLSGSNNNVIKLMEEKYRSSGILLSLLKIYWAFALLLFCFKLTISLLFINKTYNSKKRKQRKTIYEIVLRLCEFTIWIIIDNYW